MKERARPIHSIAAPVKSLAQRFAYLSLMLASFGLMLLGKADTVVVERLRAHVTDAVAPILDGLSRPAATIAEGVDRMRELVDLRGENSRLREANARLLQWQAVARRMEAENAALRGMLNYNPGPEARFISGRVIADAGGAFVESLILNAGAREGVRKGSPVVTGDGLVGRIAGVGYRSARVLLITDLNSRIPVLVESTGVRALLAGDNSHRPRLIRLPPGATVSPGERVSTSGRAGAFPRGLPVGVVASVSDGGIRLQPFVERDRLEHVRVVDFGLDGILRLPQSPQSPQSSGAGAGGRKGP